MSVSSFICKKCGACCKRVGAMVPSLPMSLVAFFQPTKKGWCHYLKQNEDGTFRCAIYEKRPLFCRVEELADERCKTLKVSKEEYYQLTADACERLRKKYP